MNWEAAERVQKNDAGQYRALIGGEWVPVERAQKNDAGEFRVIRFQAKDQTPTTDQMAAVATGPEAIAGLASVRGVVGAAAPFFAGAQVLDKLPAIPGPLALGKFAAGPLADAYARYEEMKRAGMKEHGTEGIDVAGLVGSAVSPVVGAAAKIPMAAGLLARTGQGAAVGGGLGAATPIEKERDDFLSQKASQAGFGAAAGGLVSAFAPPIINAGIKIWDVLKGRYGQVTAARIARAAAGGDINAIKAATAAAPADVTAAQATAGVKNDVWDALGEIAKANDKSSAYSRLLERQKQERLDAVRQLAGGPTQTEAKQTSEASRKALGMITTPMRETELGAANTAGQLLPRLQGRADQLGAGASEKVEDVRRLMGAAQKAEELAHSGAMRLGRDMVPPPPGLPRAPERYAYGTELAQLADDVASTAAKDSLILGEARRFAQMQADSLAAHGLRPLDSGSVVSALRQKLSDPSTGVEDLNRRVLTRVALKIKEWTERGGGIIDARALYEIRKSAVNNEVDRLLATADPATKAKRAAKILTQLKPLIDDAIEKAGGTGWRTYLDTYERGAHIIDQQRLGAKALDMLESNPQRFLDLVKGNEPREVEKIFGREFDIQKAMGDRKFSTLRGIAEQMERDKSILEGAARGQRGLQRILKEHESRFILPNWIDRQIALTNRVLKEIESNVSESTLNALVEGMKTGRSASELLNTLPVEERLKALRALLPFARSSISAASGGE